MVCEIGCGQQPLKWFLPRDAIYLPADLVARTPDTEICDLNTGKLPLSSLALCEVAVLLGVLEYMDNPEQLFGLLAERVEFLVFSYNPTDTFRERASGWISHLSEADLRRMLTRQGFLIERSAWFDCKRRLLLRARNSHFDSQQRADRERARAGHTKQTGLLSFCQRLYHRAFTIKAAMPDYIHADSRASSTSTSSLGPKRLVTPAAIVNVKLEQDSLGSRQDGTASEDSDFLVGHYRG